MVLSPRSKRNREDEAPLSPGTKTSVPEIFSSKRKVYTLSANCGPSPFMSEIPQNDSGKISSKQFFLLFDFLS